MLIMWLEAPRMQSFLACDWLFRKWRAALPDRPACHSNTWQLNNPVPFQTVVPLVRMVVHSEKLQK
jgi:hypothetical protein